MFNARAVLALKVFGWFSAAAAFVLGLSVLGGWAAGFPTIVTVQPGLAAMAPVTAVCFAISGLSLGAWKLDYRRAAHRTSLLLLAIGLAVLAGYLTTGTDVLNPLIGNRLPIGAGVLVGRTAPATACGFVLLGAALTSFGRRDRSGRLVMLICGTVGLLLSGLAVLGYAYGLEGLYAVRFYSTVALHTAAGLFALYLACLVHEPEHGWTAILASSRPGGMNGRHMADAGRVLRPGLKVLFITGYAETAALGDGHLEGGMQVLTKRFAIGALAERVGALV